MSQNKAVRRPGDDRLTLARILPPPAGCGGWSFAAAADGRPE